MKSQTRVLVIGGGIAGCSTLYHLTRMGWSDVVLVERGELTSGSTWHASGNVPNFSPSLNIMKLQSYSIGLYERLEEETGQDVGLHLTGSLRLADNAERMDEFRRIAAMGRLTGIEFALIGPDEIKARHPFVDTDGLLGALADARDGHIDPSGVTQALAKGARDSGAEIVRNNPVEAIARQGSGPWQVTTPKGVITADILVNAAGFRAGEVAAMVGHPLPMVSMEHQYVVTEDIDALRTYDGELPLLRDVDASFYLRQERKGLVLGPYEKTAPPWAVDGVPPEFGQELLPPDLDRLEEIIEKAIRRVPLIAEGGVKTVVNGAITYTPDGGPLIGPQFGVPDYFLCTAFSFGIVQGGGGGKACAQWIVDGGHDIDPFEIDPRRFGPHATIPYTVEKACEIYHHEYVVAYPDREWPAGRPARSTPIDGRLAAKGAVFGSRFGWERPNWFAPKGTVPEDVNSFRHTNWFEPVGAECRAVRQRVGVLNLSGFSKFEVSGTGAEAFLDGLVANRVPRSTGAIVLAHALTPGGGIAAEFTITRLSDDRFYLVSAAAAEHHDLDWLRDHAPTDGSVTIEAVTTRLGNLVVAGPESRKVLAQLTDADLSNSAFPWLSARHIEIGYAPVRALRVNFVGELGWELHHPIESQCAIYDALFEAGADAGIADFGLRAMDSLRFEKAYRMWGAELTRETTPLEAGLERFVKFDNRNFVGREALLRQRDEGLSQKLACLRIDVDRADAKGWEPVLDGKHLVGATASGGYAHTLGHGIALAYVRPDLVEPGTPLAVEILGDVRPATVLEDPPFDPANERLRADG